MRIQPSLLWQWNGTIGRLAYLLTGVLLFLLKFAIDWTIAKQFFGKSWSPWNYLIWPDDRTLGAFVLPPSIRTFALTMLAVSLPFIWAGVILTLHRLRAAGLPLALIVFFFVPLLNLLLFLVLILLPSQDIPTVQAVVAPQSSGMRTLRQAHRRLAGDSHWRSGAVALVITVPLAVLAVVLGAEVLQSYGFSLFVGGPFALGMIAVLLYGFSRPQPFGACILVSFLAATIAGVALFSIAMEGAICLIMAAPIILWLVFCGALVGYLIQARPWLRDQTVAISLLVLVALPALMAAEAVNEPDPDLRAVHTAVIIDAPPERVWPHVIAFPALPEPDDWFFRTGIAYPQRAEIHGSGVGAVRHCVFSTGTFVEPIEVWDPPSLLRFSVTDQPEPMREWSPYRLHPAHLDHYFVSRRGQFHLEALPDGRTRMVGTTWYTNRMWPALYWNLWSDFVIHRIHRRVLEHIQKLAE